MTGLDLDSSPCTTIDGTTALQLVRARHLEIESDGTYIDDPTGDLGRIDRAHVLLAIAFDKLARLDSDPLELDRISRILADHATLDDGLGLSDLVGLARRVAAHAGTATFDDLPVASFTSPSGAAALELATGAGGVLEAYGAPSAPPASASGAAVHGAVPIAPC